MPAPPHTRRTRARALRHPGSAASRPQCRPRPACTCRRTRPARRRSPATSPLLSTSVRASGSVLARPMSTSRTSPAYCAPAPLTNPGFSAPNVTVASARMACSPTAAGIGVDARTAGRRRPSAARGAVGQLDRAPRRSPLPADTEQSVDDESARSMSGSRVHCGHGFRQRRQAQRVRRDERVRGQQDRACTRAPRRASRAPAWNASPPFDPLPTSSTTEDAVDRRRASIHSGQPTRARPAASARPREAGPSAPTRRARTCSTVHTPCTSTSLQR